MPNPRWRTHGQPNVSIPVTIERVRAKRKEASGGTLSAAEKLLMRTTATSEGQKRAAQALRRSRKKRKM